MKAVLIPLGTFFAVVFLLLGANADPQDVRNLEWRARNVRPSDGALCFGAVAFIGFLGIVFFPTLWDDARGVAAELQIAMPIQRQPNFWGRHEKIEWECEDEGTVTAYRYLDVMRDKGTVEFSSGTMGIIRKNHILNRSAASWRGAMNVADRIPTMKNKSGIYAAKTPDSPILRAYREPDTVLVKLRLSGRIIEADYGYRAQKAEIVEILEHVPPEVYP